MMYSFRNPRGSLGQVIDRIWMCEDNPAHTRELILPSGTVELVFNLHDDEIRIYDPTRLDQCRRLSGAVVSGPYRTCFAIDPAQHASIMGVHFKPGGAFPFFGAVNELADTHVNLDAFWGGWAAELRAQLATAAPARRFSIMERALLARWHRFWRPHAAVSVSIQTFEGLPTHMTIREAARRVDLSERRFIQVFSREVGLTPKLYCRIQRFQRAREASKTAVTANWAAIAVDCEYFDQSHLIRDFVAFSGLRPTALASRAGPKLLTNHVPEML